MIAFCTTCKGRSQHLKQTLPRNLADNADFAACKFIVLDYSSTDDAASHVFWEYRPEIESGRLVLFHTPGQETFQMAHAKNMAHRLGMLEGADILVNLDADNFTGPGFARWVAERFEANPDIFLWANRNQPEPLRFAKGCNGRIVVSSRAFLNAGGYDEKYATWGPDDKDFNFRLRRMGYAPAEIRRQFLDVILHTDKMRFREYPEARCQNYDEADAALRENTIANWGIFGCGTVYRNFDPVPIDLAPLPTRIFGIGMHKTATTSLHHALEMLGYDSAHWKSAHWAKAIWQEMNRLGRSATLERSYALCDLPITLLYRQLDRAYPRSKFILTVREESRWIETVKAHWNPEINPFRKAWNTDPFSHRIHQVLYGRQDFDAATMLARYRRHNREVMEYFKGRRSDLLVMDMDFGWPKREDRGAGWPELCGFLGQPVPKAPYPRSFAAY